MGYLRRILGWGPNVTIPPIQNRPKIEDEPRETIDYRPLNLIEGFPGEYSSLINVIDLSQIPPEVVEFVQKANAQNGTLFYEQPEKNKFMRGVDEELFGPHYNTTRGLSPLTEELFKREISFDEQGVPRNKVAFVPFYGIPGIVEPVNRLLGEFGVDLAICFDIKLHPEEISHYLSSDGTVHIDESGGLKKVLVPKDKSIFGPAMLFVEIDCALGYQGINQQILAEFLGSEYQTLNIINAWEPLDKWTESLVTSKRKAITLKNGRVVQNPVMSYTYLVLGRINDLSSPVDLLLFGEPHPPRPLWMQDLNLFDEVVFQYPMTLLERR
jgi:hypothetical protein